MILTKEYLLKIERCSPLLPPPGPEVVEELLGHIWDTQHQFTVAIADEEERIRQLDSQREHALQIVATQEERIRQRDSEDGGRRWVNQ